MIPKPVKTGSRRSVSAHWPGRGALLFGLLLWTGLPAAVKDTVLHGDGTPGPYILTTSFIDTTTLEVHIDDGMSAPGAHTWVPDVNGILFSGPVDSGISIRVRYETRFHGISRRAALFAPLILDTADTALLSRDSVLFRPVAQGSTIGGDLEISGYKSVGIAVGSMGSSHLTQALDVSLFGEIAPQTQLRAHLSDQGSSLEGTTREIGEIDMIYLTLTNPGYNATVGDQYLSWPAGGLLSGEKKIKGMSASWTPGPVSAKGFGAISGGSFTVETLRGRTGFQGPYALTGNGQQRITAIVSGTVGVKVNGTTVSEGEDKDFTVDYDLGTITFTPRRLITDEDFIRVEYEFRTYDYQRTLLGSDLGFASRDSLIVIRGALWNERDAASRPIDIDLSPEDRDSLRLAGDRVYHKAFGRRIHPNDAAAEAVLHPLYTDAIDEETGRRIFRYINPDTATAPYRYFQVDFAEAEPGLGDYALDREIRIQPGRRYDVYVWKGPGRGTHICSAPFPAPQRTTAGEIFLTASPAPWIGARINVAGQETDRNTLSSHDDHDNYGAATAASITLGNRATHSPGFRLSADHRFTSRRFAGEALSADARRRGWDRTGARPGQENIWEMTAGIAPRPRTYTESGYGQVWDGDSLTTDRLSNRTGMMFFDRLGLTYSGNYFRHFNNPGANVTRRDSLRTTLTAAGATWWIFGADEWRTRKEEGSRGHLSIGAGFEEGPLGLSEQLIYSSHRASRHREVFFAADTGYSLLWTQSLNRRILPSWRVSASTSHHRTAIRPSGTGRTTTLIRADQEITTKRGFSSRQEYSVNSEQAAALVQTPKYVGAGLGTHTIDSSGAGDKYIPRVGGEWIIQERRLHTEGDNLVRRTSFTGDWSYLPPPGRIAGILADIEWRGTAGIEEHLDMDRELRLLSWAPGYYSLLDSSAHTPVRFADLYYRQNAQWRPGFSSGLRGVVFGEPFLKIQRDYRETGIKGGGGIDRSRDRIFLGAVTEYLRLWRRPATSGIPDPVAFAGLEASDGFVELTQKYRVIGDLELFIKETGGRTGQNLSRGNWYYALTPGLSWRPVSRGWAQASYTTSRVEGSQRRDYRTARGYPSGTSHVIDAVADITIKESFSLHGSYRGEISSEYRKGMHAVSVELKAYL